MSGGFELLMEGLVRSSVLLVLAIGCARLHRLSAATRHVVLLAVFAWLMLLPVQMTVGPRWELNVLPAPQLSGAVTLPIQGFAALSAPHAPAPSARTAAAASDAGRVRSVTGAGAALAIYLIGVALLVFVRIVAMLRIQRILSRSSPAPDFAINAQGAPVRISRECSLPFVTGLLRPAIVLPEAARTWSRGEIEAVLMHELAHARRRDPLAILLVDLGLAACWPNPLAWIAARRARTLAELACDDAAVRAGAEPTDYAHLLVRLARATRGMRLLAIAPGVIGRSDLGLRVQRLLQGRGSRPSSRMLLCACAVIMLATGALAGGCVPTSAQRFEGSVDQTYNLSDGGTDVSRNRAGLQARWQEAGRHSGVFVTGNVDFEAALAGANTGAAGASLVVMSEDASGQLRALAWPGAAIGGEPWAVHTLSIAADKFRQLAFDDDDAAPSALTPRALPAPPPARFPGSTMQGPLPSFSTDPRARVIQAGWIANGERTGMFVRGDWSVRAGQLRAGRAHSWLLLFAVDPRTGTLRRVQAGHPNDAAHVTYTVNGKPTQMNDVAYAWLTEALRIVEQLRSRAYRDPPAEE